MNSQDYKRNDINTDNLSAKSSTFQNKKPGKKNQKDILFQETPPIKSKASEIPR